MSKRFNIHAEAEFWHERAVNCFFDDTMEKVNERLAEVCKGASNALVNLSSLEDKFRRWLEAVQQDAKRAAQLSFYLSKEVGDELRLLSREVASMRSVSPVRDLWLSKSNFCLQYICNRYASIDWDRRDPLLAIIHTAIVDNLKILATLEEEIAKLKPEVDEKVGNARRISGQARRMLPRQRKSKNLAVGVPKKRISACSCGADGCEDVCYCMEESPV